MQQTSLELQAENFQCPISHQLMFDPVLASDGYTYERECIETVLRGSRTVSPMTRKPLTFELRPNVAIRELIADYLRRNPHQREDLFIPANLPDYFMQLLQAGKMAEVQRLLNLVPRHQLVPLQVSSSAANLWHAAVTDRTISIQMLAQWHQLLRTSYPVLWSAWHIATRLPSAVSPTLLAKRLVKAIKIGDMELVQLLLQMGADRNYASSRGRTLLQTALHARRNEIFCALWRAGCPPTVEAHTQYTLLHLAVMYKDVENVRWLLQHGIDVHAQSLEGYTALHCAVCSQVGEEIISLLIQAGADYKMPNHKGQTPLDLEIDPYKRSRWEEIHKTCKRQRWENLHKRIGFLQHRQEVWPKEMLELIARSEKIPAPFVFNKH